MDPTRFAKLPVRTEGAQNIEVETEYLDPRYTVELSPLSPATKSGLINLFRVVPKQPSLPAFAARWDDREQTVDVDAEPSNCVDRDSWRDEKNGYHGHHTNRLTDDPRVYQIDLQTPQGSVFKARVRLNIKIGVQLGFGATADIACDAVVTKVGS